MVRGTSCPVREGNSTKCCNYQGIEALATGCMALGEVARSEGQVREVALRVGQRRHDWLRHHGGGKIKGATTG